MKGKDMDKLQAAIHAIKQGDKATGKKLLIEVLRADPKSERAWLWMSTVVKNLSQREECLAKVLAINPNNQNAQRNLKAVQIKLAMQSGKPSAGLHPTPQSAVVTAEEEAKPKAARKLNAAKMDELEGLLRYELSEGTPPNALITRYAKKGYPRGAVEKIVRKVDAELVPVNEGMPLSQLLFSTEGRIPRSTYWYFILASFMVNVIAILLDLIVGTFRTEGDSFFFTLIVSVLLMYPAVAVYVKRLHDRDRSGWFLLLGAIPFVNIWIGIEMGFLRGTYGANQYGADPLLNRGKRKPNTYTIGEIPPTS